jgi:hypothetical protein
VTRLGLRTAGLLNNAIMESSGKRRPETIATFEVAPAGWAPTADM